MTNEVGAHPTSHSRSGGITRLGESEAGAVQQLQPGNEFRFDSVRTQAATPKLGLWSSMKALHSSYTLNRAAPSRLQMFERHHSGRRRHDSASQLSLCCTVVSVANKMIPIPWFTWLASLVGNSVSCIQRNRRATRMPKRVLRFRSSRTMVPVATCQVSARSAEYTADPAATPSD